MKISITKIKPHPINKEIYSLSNLDDLIKSIEDVGLLQPLTINQFNQIISGHRRFECIKKLGWKDVEVEIKYVDEVETDFYLVQYNKQRIKSIREILNEYDVIERYYENKRGKIKKVRANNHKDENYNRRDLVAEEIGVKSSQLGKLLFIRKYREDYIDLIDREIITTHQAYIQTNRERKENSSISIKTKSNKSENENWRVYYKSSDDLSELYNEEVQTIFTSPPYWNKRTYIEGGGLGNETKPRQFVENLSNHLKDCYRVLNHRGSFFLNIGDTYLDGDLQNIPHQVVLKLKEQGWILRNTIIWSKTNPKPSSSKTNLTSSYEYIFHLVKSKDYLYNQTLTELSNNSKPSLPPRHRNVDMTKTLSFSPYFPNQNGKNMGDFWNEDIVRTSVANQKLNIEREHPAPYPKEIVILPILQTSNENDLILDPFMGSGTTGRVCDDLGRRFVGYDLIRYF